MSTESAPLPGHQVSTETAPLPGHQKTFRVRLSLMFDVVPDRPVEYCVEEMDTLLLIDLAFNSIYLLHFGLRVRTASDI